MAGTGGRPTNPKRPIPSKLWSSANESRIGYLALLRRELAGTTSDTARVQLLKMIGTVLQWFDPPPPPPQPSPETPAEIEAALRDDMPRWSDSELLIAHAEGLRRKIPGFVAR